MIKKKDLMAQLLAAKLDNDANTRDIATLLNQKALAKALAKAQSCEILILKDEVESLKQNKADLKERNTSLYKKYWEEKTNLEIERSDVRKLKTIINLYQSMGQDDE